MKRYTRILAVCLFLLMFCVSCFRLLETTSPLAIPYPVFPEDGEEIHDDVVLFRWTPSEDPEGSPITYTLRLAQDPEILDQKTYETDTNRFQVIDLDPGKWFWTVTVKDAAGNQAISPVWEFTIIDNPQARPQQIHAAVNSSGALIELTFDRPMRDPTGAHPHFTVHLHSSGTYSRDSQMIDVIHIGWKPASYHQFILTLEDTVAYGDDIWISYQRGTIQSAEGAYLRSYTSTEVENLVAGDAPVLLQAEAFDDYVLLTFDQPMQEPPVQAIDSFFFNVNGSIRYARHIERLSDPRQYRLDFAHHPPVLLGQKIMLSYAQGQIQAQNYAYLKSFEEFPVDNLATPPPPLCVEARSSFCGNRLEIMFDQAMVVPKDQQNQFAVTTYQKGLEVHRVNLSSINPHMIILDLFDPVLPDQTAFVSYTPGAIVSQAQIPLEAFSDRPVVNRVQVEEPVLVAALMMQDRYHISLRFNIDMANPAGKHRQFGALINGFANETVSVRLDPADSKFMMLELNRPVGNYNEIHLSYIRGNIQSAKGGYLETFQHVPVDAAMVNQVWVSKDNPWDFASIQSAIDRCEDGETIFVSPGVYQETIELNEKSLHIRSVDPGKGDIRQTTIIQAPSSNKPAIAISSNKSQSSIIEGFTIKGGIVVNDSSPIIRHNIITPVSEGETGRGITVIDASPEITDNRIFGHLLDEGDGAGIWVEGGSPLIARNTLTENTARNGGAISIFSGITGVSNRDIAVAVILDNLIHGNRAERGGGVFIGEKAHVRISNNEFSENDAAEQGGGIYVELLGAIENTFHELWLANLYPGTIDDPVAMERVNATNQFSDNTVQKDPQKEGAHVYYHRSVSPDPKDIVVHAGGDWIRIANDEIPSDTIVRVFDSEAALTEIASGVYTLSSGDRNETPFYQLDMAIQPNADYWITLQQDPKRLAQSQKVQKKSIHSPGITILATPNSGDQDVDPEAALQWSLVDDAVSYMIYLGKSQEEMSLVDTTENSQFIPQLEPNTLYFWRVETIDVHGVSQTSPTETFTTGKIRNPVRLVDGSTGEVKNRYSTLTEAVANANNDDLITVVGGERLDQETEEILISGKTLTIRSTNETPFVIDMNGKNARAFQLTHNASVTIQSAKIKKGYTTDDGGAIHLQQAVLTTKDVLISENTAKNGGAVSIGNGGKFYAIRTTISYNHSYGLKGAFGGGGVFMRTNKHDENAYFSAIDVWIAHNSTANNGGGLYIGRFSEAVLENATITNNTAIFHGGGVSIVNGKLHTQNVFVTYNLAQGSSGSPTTAQGGGGIYLLNSSAEFFAKDTVISYNIAEDAGGGVMVCTMAKFNATRCIISGNTSNQKSGGGVFLYDKAHFFAKETIIKGNTSLEAEGGGVYLRKESEFTSSSTIIEGNTARGLGGGGVFINIGNSFTANAGTQIKGNIANTSDEHSGGGGVFLSLNGKFYANDVIISNNHANFTGPATITTIGGGGIFVRAESSGTLVNTNGQNWSEIKSYSEDFSVQSDGTVRKWNKTDPVQIKGNTATNSTANQMYYPP